MEDRELFDLCQQVYEKTGWGDILHVINLTGQVISTISSTGNATLYTSDYLLEKLLPITYSIQVYRRQTGLIDLMWMPQKPMYDDVVSDTPLKALLKLTLALSEAGEL